MAGMVQINYKSGHLMVVKCDGFSVTRNGLGSVTVEWENLKPRPLLIGVDDIESVWEL